MKKYLIILLVLFLILIIACTPQGTTTNETNSEQNTSIGEIQNQSIHSKEDVFKAIKKCEFSERAVGKRISFIDYFKETNVEKSDWKITYIQGDMYTVEFTGNNFSAKFGYNYDFNTIYFLEFPDQFLRSVQSDSQIPDFKSDMKFIWCEDVKINYEALDEALDEYFCKEIDKSCLDICEQIYSDKLDCVSACYEYNDPCIVYYPEGIEHKPVPMYLRDMAKLAE